MNVILTYIINAVKNFIKSDFLKILPYIIIAGLAILLYFSFKGNFSQRDRIKTYESNIKAYDTELSGLKKESQMFQFKRDQLLSLNDSLVSKLIMKSKELGIKDSRLLQMQYMKSKVVKEDSLVLKHDTIFKDPSVSIDTVVGDQWCSTRLVLKYPSIIKVSTSVTSEKFLYIVSKKETVNPPKKFFLFRWFQRKHTVLEIKVTDNNPYIENKEQKFIRIIK